MTWQHFLCAVVGVLALLSQHMWESRRAKAHAKGKEYNQFDIPVAVTIATLVIPGVLSHHYPDIPGLWWAWGAGAAVIALPTIVMRLRKRKR